MFFTGTGWQRKLAGYAPLPLRLIVGYGFMAHGCAKLMKGPDAFAAIVHAMGVPERKQDAIAHLTAALAHWKRYAAVSTAQYKPQLLNRVGNVDLNALTSKVAQDIAIADAWQR